MFFILVEHLTLARSKVNTMRLNLSLLNLLESFRENVVKT